MNAEEAASFLNIAATYTGRRYPLVDCEAWAKEIPDWISPELARLAVDEFYRTQTIDGHPPTLTPRALAEMCRRVREKLPDWRGEDDTISVPKSAEGRRAAAYSSVVQRVFLANPDMDQNGQDYYHMLSIASGVLLSECDLHGNPYENHGG